LVFASGKARGVLGARGAVAAHLKKDLLRMDISGNDESQFLFG
jgi:hypothetical protein